MGNSLWNVLEGLMVELKSRGVEVPPDVVQDLRSARTMSKILERDASALEVGADLAAYMARVEPALLYLAESRVNQEYADAWQMKIQAARAEKSVEPVQASAFRVGVPKSEDWIRVKMEDLIPDAELDAMLLRLHLTAKKQADGHLLIHGDQANVKALIEKMRERVNKGRAHRKGTSANETVQE